MPIIRKHFSNPLHRGGRSVYFENVETKQQYIYLVGAIGVPWLQKKGYAMVLACDYSPNPDLKNAGTSNRNLRVIDEIEDIDFKPLMQGAVALRDKWCIEKEPILFDVWHSGLVGDANLQTLVGINEKYIDNETGQIWLSNSEEDFAELINAFYANQQAILLKGFEIIKGYVEKFRPEDAKKPKIEREWPAISALAHAVHYIVSFKPWTTDSWWNELHYEDRSPWDEAASGGLEEPEEEITPEKRIATMEDPQTEDYYGGEEWW